MIKLNPNAFLEGESPSLEAVLNNRERRVGLTHMLLDEYPNSSVVCFKLNIPGPVKRNELIDMLFEEGVNKFKTIASDWTILREEIITSNCGPEAYFVLNEPSIKERLIELEDASKIARLYDFDLTQSDGTAVSRSDFNISERKCLICNESSKVCGRNRTHSIEDLHKKMIEILVSERSDVFYE